MLTFSGYNLQNLTMKLVQYTALALFVGAIACSSSGGQEESNQASVAAEPEETEVVPAELTQAIEKGKTVYGQYCVACHQVDGNGVAGAFPPLTKSEWIEGDKTRLIGLVLNGMQGPITVKGEEYNNVMPPHGFLTDEDIAATLTYVRQAFGNDASEITTAEVAEVRASGEGEASGTN